MFFDALNFVRRTHEAPYEEQEKQHHLQEFVYCTASFTKVFLFLLFSSLYFPYLATMKRALTKYEFSRLRDKQVLYLNSASELKPTRAACSYLASVKHSATLFIQSFLLQNLQKRNHVILQNPLSRPTTLF